MDSGIIRSRHNSLVRHARAVRDRREAADQIFIEGTRLSEEALGSRLNIQEVLYTEKLSGEERGARLLHELRAEGSRLSIVSEEVLAFVADTRTPQGIIMLASRPPATRETLLAALKVLMRRSDQATPARSGAPPLLVILHGINNPSNAGAILRTAEAAGASGVIITRGTADIFAPKALRGAMGSSFRLPLWTGAEFVEALDWCKEQGLRIIGSSLNAEHAHTETDWTLASSLVVGAEASGLTADELSMLDEAVKIPMRPPVESLNAAVATGIILYEADRQRRAGGRRETEG
jgi:RNA methyltransferase, TrmH family